MILFWIVALGLALAVGATVLAVMRRGHGAQPAAADYDIAVYRDQLSEVDRDLARGLVDEDAATRIRTEIGRRILDADRAARTGPAPAAPPRMGRTLSGLALLLVAAGSALLYTQLGAPGYRDLPLQTRLDQAEDLRRTRPSQTDAESVVTPAPGIAPDAQYADLLDKLRQAVAQHPDDLQGLTLLVRNEAALGNFAAAHAAQHQRLAVLGDTASGQDWADYADLLILAAGGYVSPEAETALGQALARDPANGPARYYSGLLFAQTGRPDKAFGLWRQLLDTSPPEAPWVPPVRAQIEEAAARAGIAYQLPPAVSLPGPSRADIEAAETLDDAGRAQMIQGMVDSLADRLASQGGPAEEWARLISALGVLGETDRARAIWTEGRAVFSGDAAGLALLAQAASQAGLSQ